MKPVLVQNIVLSGRYNMSAETEKPINVLIADDQQLLLAMFKQVLTSGGMNVVGECMSVESVIEMYKTLKPDVLLLDIRFGTELNGFNAMTSILNFDPLANICIISQFDYAPYISRAYALGAKAFLTKHCDETTLLDAIKKANKGLRYYMPSLVDKIVDNSLNAQPDPKVALSKEDFEIFLKIAEGKKNTEVATDLSMHVNVVSSHRTKIERILNIDRPQQFTMLAIRFGHIQA